MTPEDLKIGGRYNWINQPERLVYIGTHKDHHACRGWFQFAKVTEFPKVWCEVRAEDLARFEETKEPTPQCSPEAEQALYESEDEDEDAT
jgi:hypothetical protein